jgi:predicted N-acetyltransferase YhbS
LTPLRLGSQSKALDIWNGFFPNLFALTPRILEQQILDSRLTLQDLSGCRESAFIAAKRSPLGTIYGENDPKTAHISAFAFFDPADGLSLLEDTLGELKERGFTSAQFGADHDHLLPGCPVGFIDLEGILLAAGFHSGSEEVDLERDLQGYAPPTGCLDVLDQANVEIRVGYPSDQMAAEKFLLNDFPGRWHFDVMRKLKEDPKQVDLLFVDNECHGFSFTQSAASRHPVAGAVWNASLGKDWGALGPIGVSRAVRGRGLGNALLGASLKRLSEQGARQTIIDWTTLADFYGKHGFEITRRYKGWSIDLN